MKCVVCQDRPPESIEYYERWCATCVRAWRRAPPDAERGQWAAARARRFERKRNAARLAAALRLVDDVRERMAQVERERDEERAALDSMTEAHWHAVGECNQLRRERDEAIRAAEHNAGRVIAEQERREKAEAALMDLRALVRRVVGGARWQSHAPDVEWHADEATARADAERTLSDYIADSDLDGMVNADAGEVAVCALLTVWRVADDGDEGTRLDRDPDAAALLEVAREECSARADLERIAAAVRDGTAEARPLGDLSAEAAKKAGGDDKAWARNLLAMLGEQ